METANRMMGQRATRDASKEHVEEAIEEEEEEEVGPSTSPRLSVRLEDVVVITSPKKKKRKKVVLTEKEDDLEKTTDLCTVAQSQSGPKTNVTPRLTRKKRGQAKVVTRGDVRRDAEDRRHRTRLRNADNAMGKAKDAIAASPAPPDRTRRKRRPKTRRGKGTKESSVLGTESGASERRDVWDATPVMSNKFKIALNLELWKEMKKPLGTSLPWKEVEAAATRRADKVMKHFTGQKRRRSSNHDEEEQKRPRKRTKR